MTGAQIVSRGRELNQLSVKYNHLSDKEKVY